MLAPQHGVDCCARHPLNNPGLDLGASGSSADTVVAARRARPGAADLALVQAHIHAGYRDVKTSKRVQARRMARAAVVTDRPPTDLGERSKVRPG